MNYTIKLLDKYREVCGIKTDMGAAEALGLGRSAVSGWRHGNRHAEADAVEKMAKAIGEPVGKWLHLIEAERARTPAAAKVWLRLAQAAAAIALAVGLSPAHAATTGTLRTVALSGSHDLATVYIMRN
jgi:hypothetical protein